MIGTLLLVLNKNTSASDKFLNLTNLAEKALVLADFKEDDAKELACEFVAFSAQRDLFYDLELGFKELAAKRVGSTSLQVSNSFKSDLDVLFSDIASTDKLSVSCLFYAKLFCYAYVAKTRPKYESSGLSLDLSDKMHVLLRETLSSIGLSELEIQAVSDFADSIRGSDERELVGTRPIPLLNFITAKAPFCTFLIMLIKMHIYAPIIAKNLD